jgi:hypothetical protein
LNAISDLPVCLAVTGADRIDFLQGQLTQDLRRLDRDPILTAAWCNPKGRVMALVTVVGDGDRVLVFLPGWQADDFAERLLRYRLRAAVDIATEPGVRLAAVDSGPGGVQLPEGEPVLAIRPLPGSDPRVMEICAATAHVEELDPATLLSADAWRLACIRAGRPVLHPDTVEAFTPHMLNLDLLDAISFSKGCYTGQEVVARTENLGRPSRRMLRFAAAAPPPAPGSRLLDEAGGTAGSVVQAAAVDGGSELLAVVSIKQLGGALGLEDGTPAAARGLPYSVPEAEGA